MDNRRGIILMVLAMAAFAVEDALIKLASRHIPPGQILAAIGLLGFLPYAFLTMRRGLPLVTRDALHPMALLRLAGEMLGSILLVLSLALVPLATVSALLQALPLGVVAAAAIFLKHPVGWRRWSAVAVGFAGVLMIVRPGTEGFVVTSLLTVAAVAAFTLRDVATSLVPRKISTLQLAAWVYIALVPTGMAQSLLLGETWRIPDGEGALIIAATTMMGVLGYWAVTEAMRISEVSLIAPFRYVRLLFALLIAVVFLGERPGVWTLAGAAVIILSGLYTLNRERLRRRPAPIGTPIRTDLQT